MKRIIYSCLLVISLFLVKNGNAQAFNMTITPQTFCYDGVNPVLGQAAITSTGISNSFTYTVTAPAGCPAATFTYDPAFPDGQVINITYNCCGNYQVDVIGYTNGPPNVTGMQSKFPTVTCTNALTITPNPASNFICSGTSATLTASGANSYTWQPGGFVGAVLVVTPTAAATCYTATGTTVSGCTVQAVSCVSVQTTSVTVTPTSQTICAGGSATMNAVASSNSVGIQWLGPPTPPSVNPTPLGTNLTQVVTPTTNTGPAPVGSVYGYTAVVASFGGAGNCTASAVSNVVIGTAIPMTLTASSASVCPGATFTLTANPPGATTYTFSHVTPPTTSVNTTGVNTATFAFPSNNANNIYTVIANYSGCPGSGAGVTIATATLTPTLVTTPSLSCAGRQVTLTATGGANYTLIALPSTTISAPANTTGTAVNTPVTLPITYSVFARQNGCSGGTSFTLNPIVLHPTLSVVSVSVCPSNPFTLTALGTGITHTFTAPAGLSTGPNTPPTANTATSAIPSGSFPATYTVIADSLGCRGSATVTMLKRVLTTTLTSSSASVCPGGTFTLSASNGATTNYTFTAPPGLAVTPSITTGSPTSSIPTGSFPATYTVVADSSGCQGTATATVNLLSLSNHILASAYTGTALTPSVCPNSNFTLVATNGGTGATASSYTFYPPTSVSYTTLSAKNDTVNSLIPPSAFPATYTIAADSMGCVGTNTVVVKRLYVRPTLSVTPVGAVCAGSQVTITASAQSTLTTYSFSYAPVSNPFSINTLGTPSQTSNAVTHSPTVATIYAVSADSSGCTTQVPGSATVNILPDLPLTVTATSVNICSGTQSTLSVNNVTTYTYTWFASTNSTVAIPTTPPDTSIVVNPTVNTTYTVHAVNPGGCVGNAVITVSVDPTASLSISAIGTPSTICPQSTSTLSASGALSYTWLPATDLSGTSGPTVVSTPSATIIYTVIGDNTLGCYGAATVAINVVIRPQIQIVPSSHSVCTGYTSTLTAFGALNYTWTGIAVTGNSNNPVYTPITPVNQQAISVGTGTYYVVGSNGGNCLSDTASIAIGHMDNLTLTTTQSSYTTCIANNSPKYSKPVVLNASGASDYSWFPYNPAYMTYSLGPQTTVIPPATTQYTVTGYTSVCSGTAAITVTVIPQFTMNVVPPLPAMCTGDSLRLNIVNISSLAVGPVSAFTYSWTEPQNAILSLSNPLASTVIAFPSSTSTYSVEMRDSRSCVSIPRLVTVTVYPRPLTTISIPTINSVPTNTICFVGNQPGEEGNLLTLTGNNTNVGLPFGVVPTYTWLPPPEYTSTSILTSPNNNFVIVNAPVRTPSVVVYTLLSGYNGIPGCIRYDTVSVRVIDCRPVTPDKVKFTTDRAAGDTICTRQCLTFTSLTDTAAGGPQKLLWTFPGGAPATSTLQFPTVCYNLPNSYNVVLRVENPYPKSSGGSSASAGVFNFVKVVDVPNVSIVAPAGLRSDTTVRFGQSVSLSGSGALSYIWFPLYNISGSTNPNVTVHPFQTTQYILTGYNSKTCYSSDTVNVIIIPDCGEMYVPNAFSPNNDTHNDKLYVRGICLQSLTFMIFNRWGEKVFETIDQTVGWDGTYRGEDANSGVYVFRLEGKTYDGKGYSLKGNITLIR